MGVVAPVTGVLAAIIPVVAGIVARGPRRRRSSCVGIALALVAVVLVSRVDDEGGGPSGLGLALVAGIGLGLFGVSIAQISDGHVFGPLTVVRATEARARRGGRPRDPVGVAAAARPLVPAIGAVGVLDMAGNGAFILAVQAGALAVAAVLSSLYPVTTVILATLVLHERVTRSHASGSGWRRGDRLHRGRLRVDSAIRPAHRVRPVQELPMTELPSDVASRPVWLVEATYAPDAAETRGPFRARHLARLVELREPGVIVEIGAFLDVSSSVILVRAADEAAALDDRPGRRLHGERHLGGAPRRGRSGGSFRPGTRRRLTAATVAGVAQDDDLAEAFAAESGTGSVERPTEVARWRSDDGRRRRPGPSGPRSAPGRRPAGRSRTSAVAGTPGRAGDGHSARRAAALDVRGVDDGQPAGRQPRSKLAMERREGGPVARWSASSPAMSRPERIGGQDLRRRRNGAPRTSTCRSRPRRRGRPGWDRR